MKTTPFLQRRSTWLGAVILLVLGAGLFFLLRKKDPVLKVPLGVEQAAIVSYSGPPLVVAPYRWGVAVNARIASVTEREGLRIYDVRYVANRPGNYDLKNFLTSGDGRPLEGMPSFLFAGDPTLSKDIEARIQQTEDMGVQIGGLYYETLAALAVLWIVWLLLLIFYKRAKPPEEAPAAPREPTFAELLRAFLAQLQAGSLDAEAKAKMEMLLLRRWREEVALGVPMSAALEAIGRSGPTGEAMRKLEHWIHHPASHVTPEEIAAVVTPYTAEPRGLEPDTTRS